MEDREEERLARTMNKVGRGRAGSNARPVSWNVSNLSSLSSKSASGTTPRKNENAEAFRVLQEQIRQEEMKNKGVEPSPRVDPSSHVEPSPIVHPSPRGEVPLESQAEISAFDAFTEQREMDRLNKWTKMFGPKSGDAEKKLPTSPTEKPVPAVLMRQFAVEDAAKEDQKQEPNKQKLDELNQALTKLVTSINICAKALKQQNGDVLAKGCFSASVSAKSLAVIADDDEVLLGWARALEGTSNALRGRLDGGGDGHEHFNELSNELGQLYLSAVALV